MSETYFSFLGSLETSLLTARTAMGLVTIFSSQRPPQSFAWISSWEGRDILVPTEALPPSLPAIITLVAIERDFPSRYRKRDDSLSKCWARLPVLLLQVGEFQTECINGTVSPRAQSPKGSPPPTAVSGSLAFKAHPHQESAKSPHLPGMPQTSPVLFLWDSTAAVWKVPRAALPRPGCQKDEPRQTYGHAAQ